VFGIVRKFIGLFGGVPIRVSVGRCLQINRGSSIVFGKNVKLGNQNIVTARGGRIILGNSFNSNDRVILNADIGGTLSFGDNCLVGPGCIFRTTNHKFDDPDELIRNQGHEILDIKIGNDVWFGSNVVVLPGVSLGNGCVVGAGAVITKSFNDFVILAGVPARIVGSRKT
jgi:galactoside O-acetyltransferase